MNCLKLPGKQENCWGFLHVRNYLFTGIISKEQQAKVFDHFYRSGDTDTKLHDGVGLGLSICLELIELLNGQIWGESQPREGTSFYFSLPWEG